MSSSGILCISSPCPSYQETHLNTRLTRNIHNVDLLATGASEEQLSSAYQQIADGHILAAGLHYWFQGMNGKGIALVASEFYTPLMGSAYCATATINAPHSLSPTVYAKNFTSEKEGYSWLATYFPPRRRVPGQRRCLRRAADVPGGLHAGVWRGEGLAAQDLW